MIASERFTSVLGRISRRLSADTELRAVRERLDERLARARSEIESDERDRERAARAWTTRRDAEWRRLLDAEGDAFDAEGRRPAAILRWQRRGSA